MENTQKNRTGPICMIAASICWSFGGICIKFIPWGAMSIVGLRAVLAAAGFLVYRRSIKIRFTFGNVLGVLCMSANTILFVFASYKIIIAGSWIKREFFDAQHIYVEKENEKKAFGLIREYNDENNIDWEEWGNLYGNDVND